jgi:hypothetical protein
MPSAMPPKSEIAKAATKARIVSEMLSQNSPVASRAASFVTVCTGEASEEAPTRKCKPCQRTRRARRTRACRQSVA